MYYDLYRVLSKDHLGLGQGIGTEGRNQDPKRIFYSDVMDDNELHVIVGKVNIVRIASKVDQNPCTVSPTAE